MAIIGEFPIAGPSGDGTGDMLRQIYDPTGQNRDIFQYASLRNLGAAPRRNLLGNAYFKGGGSQQGGGQFPINQRGETSYTDKNAPCIDRWRTLGGDSTVTLVDSGLQITGAGSYTWSLTQILQDAVKSAITGDTVTISVLHSKGLDSMTVENALSAESSQTFADGVSLWLSTSGQFFVGTNDTTIFYAAKLELGLAQTLAYQDEEGNWQLFETPDYAEELAKCQRFFENAPIYTGFTVGASGDNLDVFVPFKQTKRIVPTVIISPRTTSDSGKAEAWNGSGWESFSVNIQCYINGFRVFGTAPHPNNHVQFIYTASAEL